MNDEMTEFGMSIDDLKELVERRKNDLPNLIYLPDEKYELVVDFIEQAEKYLKQHE